MCRLSHKSVCLFKWRHVALVRSRTRLAIIRWLCRLIFGSRFSHKFLLPESQHLPFLQSHLCRTLSAAIYPPVEPEAWEMCCSHLSVASGVRMICADTLGRFLPLFLSICPAQTSRREVTVAAPAAAPPARTQSVICGEAAVRDNRWISGYLTNPAWPPSPPPSMTLGSRRRKTTTILSEESLWATWRNWSPAYTVETLQLLCQREAINTLCAVPGQHLTADGQNQRPDGGKKNEMTRS